MKVLVSVALLSSVLFGQVLYEEYFTGGAMQLQWHPWFTDSLGLGDSMGVINDPTTPGGDDWAGRISNEYMGVAALTYAGASDLTDYSVEAWIYTVVTAMLGPYNGIAIRMDPTSRYYYRLVSDFDDNARLRLGLIASGGYPIALRDWTGGEIPGGVPVSSSWHEFKLTMVGDSIWAYYDNVLLADCPIANDSVAQGHFGVYTFNMMDTASTKCDDIIVTDEGAGVSENNNYSTGNFIVYPNPFRDRAEIVYQMQDAGSKMQDFSLKIYDISGRLVQCFNLISGISPLASVFSWDGKDSSGNELAPGIYFIAVQHDMLAKVVKLR